MWFNGVEVAQETSAPPPKKNPGSAHGMSSLTSVHWLIHVVEGIIVYSPVTQNH